MSKLMKFAEAAEQCGCSPDTLRRAVQRGELAVIRLGSGPKSDRIHPDDLAKFLDLRRTIIHPFSAIKFAPVRQLMAPEDERIAKLLGVGPDGKKIKTVKSRV